jgi:possible glycosyltransferase
VEEKILLFIPMFNCERQIIRVLDQIDEKVKEYITETIVIDNRSTDSSQEKVIDYIKNNKNKNIKLFLNTENYNLGGSHKVAFNYAVKNNFDYVIVLHGDD